MSTREWIEVAASLIGGAGIGAAIMYLFDPESGDERRAALEARAAKAAASTGEALGGAWGSAKHAGSGVASQASRLAAAASDYLASAQDSASDAAHGAHRWGRGVANSASRSARGYLKSARKSASNAGDAAGDWWNERTSTHSSYGTAAGITAGAVGALALGAGLMFLLDPAQGRRRRALVRDKAYSAARKSSQYAQSTSRHVANKATGLAHEAGSLAEKAKEKVVGAVSKARGGGGAQEASANAI